MSRASDPLFRTFHALRIKGFARAETVADVADLPLPSVREQWQLTRAGRDQHRLALADDVGDAPVAKQLGDSYRSFLGINEKFKALCGAWQLRGGAPVVTAMGGVLQRLQPYASRLVVSCQRLLSGETNMFTGVMCGSYHDVWMELHEDLSLTQGIDRSAEGSF